VPAWQKPRFNPGFLNLLFFTPVNNLANKKVPARATPGFFNQLHNYVQLMRLDKPIGVWLLLWPTLWALWLAGEGHPDPGVFVVFMLGVIIMRSAGCVLNDFADRNIDPYVERTRTRPIASGVVAPMEALTLFIALALIAIGLGAMLNRPAQLLAVIGAGLTVIYPFIKRFVSVPQFVLGAAFGWAVPMAFAAQTESLPKQAWLLYVAALIWAVAYDTMYSMADREDDLKIGLKSTAILFGEYDRAIIGLFQALLILTLWLTGRDLEFTKLYFYALGLASLLMIYEQYLIVYRVPENCFKAFLHNHWIGAIVFFGIMGHYYSV
jgi:4-hydroxybenzoate polyprenyltransferase